MVDGGGGGGGGGSTIVIVAVCMSFALFASLRLMTRTLMGVDPTASGKKLKVQRVLCACNAKPRSHRNPVVVGWQPAPSHGNAIRVGSNWRSRTTSLISALTLRSNARLERTPSVKSGSGCGMTIAASPGA